MPKAIMVHAIGGPEVLRFEEYDPGMPGPGEALVRHEAIGVNFIDIYHRIGLYPLPHLPAVIGMEGAGIVEAVGEGVSEVSVGDRVAYAGLPPGAYADVRVIPAHRLVVLPQSISMRQAAGDDVKGNDRPIPALRVLQGQTGRYDPYPCGSGRRGDTRMPVGKAPRRNGNRNSGVEGKSRNCKKQRMRPYDPLQGGGFHVPRKGDNGRKGC